MTPKFLWLAMLMAFVAVRLYGQKASVSGETETILKIPMKTYTGLKAGDFAPDAMKVDADEIVAIVNGVCVIKKSNLFALIDLKGNFLVPWGRFEFFNLPHSVEYNLLIRVRDIKANKFAFLNTKGNLAFPIIFTGAGEFNPFRLAKVTDKDYNTFTLDAAGHTYPDRNFKNVLWSDRYARTFYGRPQDGDRIAVLVPTPIKNGTSTVLASHWGFGDKSGKLTIPAIYDDCSGFSEGMAAVAKIDQFGTKRWGYIDRDGKLVIPYTYQNHPGNFHDGLALVTALQKTDFDYAYIDRQGNIKLKILKRQGGFSCEPAGTNGLREIKTHPYYDDRDYNHINELVGYFENGYSLWQVFNGKQSVQMMDTLGHFHAMQEFVKDPGLKAFGDRLEAVQADDLGIYIKTANTFAGNNTGLVDYKGNVLYPPVFYDLAPDLYSGYASASVLMPSASGDAERTQGIVNNQGVFVLVLADKSTF